MTELQRAILREHSAVSRGEPGAKARLEELQRQYREGRHEIIRPDGTARLVGPVANATSLLPRRAKQQVQRKRRRAISRTQDPPYWQLGNEGHESWRLC